ncbi:hypothetical protein PZB74_17060 [Porifericola rhodea]|uniref:hypothetical protein n=1 Tax=Porifericola rhodea TaxID=930972 RepID=UPI0026671485|nr:hypothetical protein [Porifericola rhodea]WKN30669.1 hypothetical protein PZB74_17060 [Porifericola rhodea]
MCKMFTTSMAFSLALSFMACPTLNSNTTSKVAAESATYSKELRPYLLKHQISLDKVSEKSLTSAIGQKRKRNFREEWLIEGFWRYVEPKRLLA